MIKIQNNSDTLIIVLHEIYGVNQHIRQACDYFADSGYDVICPKLFDIDKPFEYSNEKEAYNHFMQTIGFDYASEIIKSLIRQTRDQYKYVFLVGYSIGATIAWLCSNENNMIDGVIGFYGSRIRDYLDVKPKCPVMLLFASKEKSFDVKQLASSLNKENIDIHVLKGEHGFSDPFNSAYCEVSKKQSETLVYNFIREIRKDSN